ncbi:hypothetical protein G6L16_008665 [Agrobacterium tumefaciens]|uniref:hypothetical protein n=1 Tax=Agrobacterium tumefaciens TaxID=358 RepID=UPI0015725C10|nr:hypothetical protein [Agrobacterium tumefaciens]NSZ63409.1 hypothetical protein [Agrobacterium tumefaciens]NTA69779.1 hypothetical protein [Agrobacterium tumefaciens]WIE36925.1 hypothetical protein G6L16_008665 [Agrobacterium tumefaciens]
MAEIPHVQNPVIAYAKSTGWFVRRVQWIGRVGAPDALFSKKGAPTIWIEFKDEDSDTTLMQDREHARMLRAGMLVFVVSNAALGKVLLDRYDPDTI